MILLVCTLSELTIWNRLTNVSAPPWGRQSLPLSILGCREFYFFFLSPPTIQFFLRRKIKIFINIRLDICYGWFQYQFAANNNRLSRRPPQKCPGFPTRLSGAPSHCSPSKEGRGLRRPSSFLLACLSLFPWLICSWSLQASLCRLEASWTFSGPHWYVNSSYPLFNSYLDNHVGKTLCVVSDVSRRHSIVTNSLILWRLQSFCLLFHNVSWAFGGENPFGDISTGTGPHDSSFVLAVCYAMISICCPK